MSYKVSKLRRAALFGSAATLLTSFALGAGVTSVSAQSANSDDEVEEVVVTGSRIRRADIESVSPVNIVSNNDLNLSGNINIERTLNELPAVTPSQTTTTNNGGSGIATIDLRDLGAARTLVLQNGRRIIAADRNARVDLNSIPSALVERVEVLTGGASAIYGSDAVAGVVNFILKRDFEGLEISGQYNLTERGDADTRTVSITGGGNFADGRGNAVFNISFTDRQALLQAERAFARDLPADFGDGVFSQFGSSNIPGALVRGRPDITLLDGTVISELGFDENGAPIDNAGGRFNFAPFQFLQTPQERVLISGLGHYEINEHVEIFWEGTYSENQVDLQLAPNAGAIPTVGALFVPATNTAINPDTLQVLLNNFDTGEFGDAVAGDGIATLPQVNRRFTEQAVRNDFRELNQSRFVVGARGDIDDNWSYETSYVYGRVNRSTVLTGRFSNTRAQQAVNVVDGPNGPECVDATGGCVPANIFGLNTISPEAVAFLSPTAIFTEESEQNIINANINGTLDGFDLGAGPAGVAFGGEYRRESAAFRPDDFVRTGELGAGNSGDAIDNGFDVLEFYGEALVPLLADLPGVERLDLEAAARVSDYSTAGGVFSWSSGLQWQVIPDIRIRGGYQRAVRAPNVGELFEGQVFAAQTTTDPCDAPELVGQSAEVAAFCQALGAPAGFTQDNTQVLSLAGGNPDLFEETADTYTLGAVITPEAIPGLEITVDYYNIEVEDAIAELSTSTVLDLCISSLDVNNPFCQQTQRLATGDLELIRSGTSNIGSLKREGIDWSINYAFELGEGQLTLQNVGNYTFTNDFTPTPISNTVDCNGIFGGQCTALGDFTSPEWRVNQNITYSIGDWQLRAQGRLIGGLDQAAFVANPDGAFAQPTIKENLYVDLAFTYQVTENLTVTGGVDNLTDNTPPIFGAFTNVAANTDPSLFDVLGRSYFLGAKVSF